MHGTLALLAAALLLFASAVSADAGLYRWVDEAGNIHYSDSVPPAQIKRGHTELNEEGVRIRSIPPIKTPEEVLKDKELARMRAQQLRIIEQQRSADRVLLRTFRSDDDIKLARDGKLAAIDLMISVTKNNIRRRQEGLSGRRSQAANLERTGKPVPKRLSENIAQTEQAIRDDYSIILDREAQKDAIRKSFERDLVRFRRLKNLPEPATSEEVSEPKPILHNIVHCADAEECSRLWSKSTDYVRQHTSTAIQASDESILITALPVDEQDIGLVLSRIDDKEGPGASLFLDLQCTRSLRGKKRCQSEEAQDIIQGFRTAIVGDHAAQP